MLSAANRIFETRLYNGFLAEKSRHISISQAAADERNQFISDGRLDLDNYTLSDDCPPAPPGACITGCPDGYDLKRGYMISFNFNQKKQTGVNRIVLGDKVLIEAVV